MHQFQKDSVPDFVSRGDKSKGKNKSDSNPNLLRKDAKPSQGNAAERKPLLSGQESHTKVLKRHSDESQETSGAKSNIQSPSNQPGCRLSYSESYPNILRAYSDEPPPESGASQPQPNQPTSRVNQSGSQPNLQGLYSPLPSRPPRPPHPGAHRNQGVRANGYAGSQQHGAQPQHPNLSRSSSAQARNPPIQSSQFSVHSRSGSVQSRGGPVQVSSRTPVSVSSRAQGPVQSREGTNSTRTGHEPIVPPETVVTVHSGHHHQHHPRTGSDYPYQCVACMKEQEARRQQMGYKYGEGPNLAPPVKPPLPGIIPQDEPDPRSRYVKLVKK